MNAYVPVHAAAAATYDPKSLAMIRRSYAAHATNDEFDAFIYQCRTLKLDPLKKQIYFFVFNRHDANKRSTAVVVGINGFRAIAARTGRYRADDVAPRFTYDKSKIGPSNPKGIVKATTKVFYYGADNQWHKVVGTAYWEEYAPIRETFDFDPQTGLDKPTGQFYLDRDSNWFKMPMRLLEKVAEAHALRKAFPDELSNVYEESEIDRAKLLDLTPSESADVGNAQARLEKLSAGVSLIVDWLDESAALDQVPIGAFADRVMAFIAKHEHSAPMMVQTFAERNRHTMNTFWGLNKTDCLALKRRIEAVTSRLPKMKMPGVIAPMRGAAAPTHPA